MTKVLLSAAFLVLSVTWVAAQNSDTTGSQSSQPGSSSAGQSSSQSSSSMGSGSETSVEGCLSGSGGNYTLTSSTGTTYQLTGDSDDLGKHVNQQVRVKGTQSASSASSSASPSSSTSPSSSSSSTSPSSSSGSMSPSGSSSASGSSPSGSSQASFTVSKVSKISDTCSASSK